MKTFYHPAGHKCYSTVTVGELREILAEYDSDLPVIATWEGVHVAITKDSFASQQFQTNRKEPTVKCLIVDVDQY